jgi:hypothetical protein
MSESSACISLLTRIIAAQATQIPRLRTHRIKGATVTWPGLIPLTNPKGWCCITT